MALTETMYLRFNTKSLADDQSAALWKQILGHDPPPNDVTQFSFQTILCKNDNSAYVVLTEPFFSYAFPKLTAIQQNFITINMVPASNVQVQNCLAANAPPPIP